MPLTPPLIKEEEKRQRRSKGPDFFKSINLPLQKKQIYTEMDLQFLAGCGIL